MDLFGQYLLLDNGRRLGTTKGRYKDAYFTSAGYGGYSYQIKDGAKDAIEAAISDITLQMSNEDYLELPPVIVNDIAVQLPPKAYQQYQTMEDDMFLQLDSGVQIEINSASSLTNKCLQAANGALYIEPGKPEWGWLHDAKLDALDDVLEEAGGTPVLVFYEFRSDIERIMERHPKAVFLRGGLSQAAVEDIVTRWNNKEIPVLIAHPASAGHGLNLQYGGHIMVWFGLNWSLDLYEQAVARLARQGQEKPVTLHRLLAASTLDYAVADALNNKATTQKELRESVERYRSKKYE